MKHEEIERFLTEAAKDYNEPPATPREEIWSAVRDRLDRREADSADPFTRRRLRGRRGAPDGSEAADRSARTDALRRWTPWALGIAAAATLAVGFGIGRVTTERGLDAGPAGSVAERESPAGSAESLPVRLATATHMNEAEAMLTMFRTEDVDAEREATTSWARELLSTTRLLMDSRAGEDPHMAELLADLELVLVQIVNANSESGEEQQLIEDGIEERQILTKLRTIAAATMETTLE